MNTTRGLALLCDEHGAIVQTLCDQVGLGDLLAAGALFPRLAAPGSLSRALSFLDELKTRGAAFGWEVHIVADSQVHTLQFNGSRVNELLLILGVENGEMPQAFGEEMMGISNAQVNALRATQKTKNSADTLYNQISSLNNELVAAQRELAKLNSELEKRVSERTLQLQEAQEKLLRHEKLAVMGQLAGAVGHELRTPLSVITNAVYFLKLSPPQEKVMEYLNVIEQETHTAGKIIGDLLEFSRTKSVSREPVVVKEILQLVLERFPAPEKVTVKFNFPADLPPVLADPQHLQQVFGNLIVNACQAMTRGGTLTLSAEEKGEEIAIAVADTGAGITPENMTKLFEPLYTTKVKGIGLGLPVTRKLVEANGGRLEVRSASFPQGESGTGSVFTVYLNQKAEM